MKIPIRLKKEPLIEAVFEVRFTPANDAISEILTGIIYSKIPEFKKSSRLDIANIPDQVRKIDQNFWYKPIVRLESEGPFFIQIGDRVVSLACKSPYSGWTEFSSRIFTLLNVIKDTDLVSKFERYSLKYTDVVDSSITKSEGIAPLKVEIKLGEEHIDTNPVHLRTEVYEKDYLHIINISSPAFAVLPDESRVSGAVIVVDTISRELDENFLENYQSLINEAHIICKAKFFELLKEKTINQLEPEYAE